MKINIKNFEISNNSPIIIIAGLNVFEDLDMAEKVASASATIDAAVNLESLESSSSSKLISSPSNNSQSFKSSDCALIEAL